MRQREGLRVWLGLHKRRKRKNKPKETTEKSPPIASLAQLIVRV